MVISQKEKDQLLAEANRRYPIGTIHTGFNGVKKYKITGRLKFYGNDIYDSTSSVGCIYFAKNNHWAKIVSSSASPIKTYELW
jgi:hypothetical protein